jgi:hypothetical protein
MISASAALFQTATKGIGAVTASAVVVNFFLESANIIQAPMKYRCRACRSYDNLLLFRKLPSEKELLKPHFDSDLSIVL